MPDGATAHRPVGGVEGGPFGIVGEEGGVEGEPIVVGLNGSKRPQLRGVVNVLVPLRTSLAGGSVSARGSGVVQACALGKDRKLSVEV